MRFWHSYDYVVKQKKGNALVGVRITFDFNASFDKYTFVYQMESLLYTYIWYHTNAD